MPVVKSGQSAPLLRHAVVLDMGDMEAHAQRLLNEARSRADAVVEQAERHAAHLAADAEQKAHTQGLERGFAEGREQGLREGREQAINESRAELAELSQRWTTAIDEWEAQRERMHDDAREDVLRFAFALAERIVHRLVRIDTSIIADQVRQALRHLSRPTMLQISAHPDDRAMIEEVLPEVAAALGRATNLHLHDDPAIERGGCVVATAGGYVDATLMTQLDRLAETILREGRLIERATQQQRHGDPDAGGAAPTEQAR